MSKNIVVILACLALLLGAAQPTLAQGGRPSGPTEGKVQGNVYTWPQAGITFTLPAAWVQTGYKWYEYWGAGSDPRRPTAVYVVEWVMVPSNPANGEQNLLTIAVYPTAAWDQIVAQGGPPPGTVIGSTASFVFVATTAQSNPYPDGSADAARYDRLYTSLGRVADAVKTTGSNNLSATSWLLAQLNGQAPVAGTSVTLNFGANGSVSGSDGCNNYSTSYTVNGSQLTFRQPIAATQRLCAEPIMRQATAYHSALAQTTGYQMAGQQLTLTNAGGQTLATFNAQNTGLAGTAWEATGYNNGKQAVVSVIIGTQLTANFGADGTISGNAGCNTYSGGYTTDGRASIKIGPLASTRKFCDQPAGVMDQEAQYLAALQSAATYRIDGGKLEMRTAADALAATFQTMSTASTGPATQVNTFNPATFTGSTGSAPVAVTCQASAALPNRGAYQCVAADGSSTYDVCFVSTGNQLLCNVDPIRNSAVLVTASQPLPAVSRQGSPAAFYVELQQGYPACAKRGNLNMTLAGQPVTFSCQAPGAWLIGNLNTAQPLWTAQYVTTNSAGTTLTFGPVAANVPNAWVY